MGASAIQADKKQHKALRFLTAGSVDDGKSTLIGRLLYDSRAILADQLDHLHARAAATAGEGAAAGGPAFDLSLLTDGLEAEREQGITIDVAYRYFATPERKFVIADAPGHEQYTRNMVTAAAGSDAAVVLVDITKLDLGPRDGLVELLPQTRRHTLLARLLRVPSIVFAVNKLDAVADPGPAFAAVARALQAFADSAGIVPAGIVPVSALRGDNVARPVDALWYRGPTLLQLLESLPSSQEQTDGVPLSLPVQYVGRESPAGAAVGGRPRVLPAEQHGVLPVEQHGLLPAEQHRVQTAEQHRVLWGRIAQGRVRVGDAIQVFPSGERATVAALRRAGLGVDAAQAGQSAGVVLDRQIDVSRGDWLAAPGTLEPVRRFAATLAWLDTEAAIPGRKYWVRHGNRWVQARILEVTHCLDIHTLQPTAAHALEVNEIGDVVVELQQPLPLAPYAGNRVGGALIVVDPASHRTSGALLVQRALDAA